MPTPLPHARDLFPDPTNVGIPLNAPLKSAVTVVDQAAKIFLPISGLILFFMIIIAGFQLLTSTNNPEQAEKAKQTLTTAFVGFAIIFSSYWIAQFLEIIFNIPITGP